MTGLPVDGLPRLPVPIRLVRHEIVESYLTRLARANHLDPSELTDYLDASGNPCGSHRFDRLAAVTGHPAERLHAMLATTVHPGQHRRREACHRCLAQHGIPTTVQLAAPTHHTICRRHRRWLPDSNNRPGQQYDLSGLPEIVAAQRQHARLVTHHEDQAAGFVTDAEHIIRRWTRYGHWPKHRHRRLWHILGPERSWIVETDPAVTMANYPETIALARLLANPCWFQHAISDGPADTARFHAEVGRRLDIHYRPYSVNDPLLDWQRHARTLNPEMAQLSPDPPHPVIPLAGRNTIGQLDQLAPKAGS